MLRVGLTGGVGSGKSTVADAFVRLGGALVDTDALAHRLTAPQGAALPTLMAAFGADILAADGGLDRAAMRHKVFADPAVRRRLEKILHPMIRKAAEAEMDALLSDAGVPYVLVAIPLLVETGGRSAYGLDRVLVVDCPEEAQAARVMARSGLNAAEVQAIIAAQASRAERLAEADDVIDNRGTRAEINSQVAQLHARYLHIVRREE